MIMVFSLSAILYAEVDCSSLKLSTDSAVCRHYTSGRPWLTSVKKINYWPPFPLTPGQLYIMASLNSKGQRAIYYLPVEVIFRVGNIAIVGDSGQTITPQLLQRGAEMGQIIITEANNKYLFADVDIISETNEREHEAFAGQNPDSMEFSGVTFSTHFKSSAHFSLPGSNVKLNLLSFRVYTDADIKVFNCTFLLPNNLNVSSDSYLNALSVKSSGVGQLSLEFKNNTIIAAGNANYTENAISLSGNIRLREDSICNEVVDYQGQDLLPEKNKTLLLLVNDLNPHNQAIGFINGYGWGLQKKDHHYSESYSSWESWENKSVYLECHASNPTFPPPPEESGDDIIPEVVGSVVGLAALITTSVIIVIVLAKYRINRLNPMEDKPLMPVN